MVLSGLPPRRKIFVSYTHTDKEWAEWIAWELEDNGCEVVIQAWDFAAGSNFVLEMQKAVMECEQTIAVLSDAYLSASFTQPEWAAAFLHDPKGRERKLIPVRVTNCKPEGLLGPIVYIDLLNLDEDTARNTILEGFSLQRQRAKPTSKPAFPIHNTAPAGPTSNSPSFPGNKVPAPHADRAQIPLVTVTLVFTDIEGSSELTERFKSKYEAVRQDHNRLMREVLQYWDGIEVKPIGDSFMFAFDTASAAVQFAVDAQLRISQHDWSSVVPDLTMLRVRFGVHTGEVLLDRHPSGAYDYSGSAVNRAARIEAAGHGGQILVSDTTYYLARPALPSEITFQDLGIHRLKGVGEERLRQVCHPNLRHAFPPLSALDPLRHNIPLPMTPFIGREETVQELNALLCKTPARLVTITGFGGMGKTRTALHVAESCVGDFANGVWWVGLENVTARNEMIQHIAEQLGLHLTPQGTIQEQLRSFFLNRELMLVLDNTEQILSDNPSGRQDDAAQTVDYLLRSGAGVKCLVTSRRSLNLAAEHCFELESLQGNEAQTLFVESAMRRKANFVLNEQNAPDVAAICHILEGVPLAIEMAASLIMLMAPRQILQKISEQLQVLNSLDPQVPPRHKALRAVVEWSYVLLSPRSKTLLANLAVFVGGFNAEAANSICNASESALMELREHCFLRGQTDGNTHQERLMMLVFVRAYAVEKFDKASKSTEIRQRHANYFLEFAEDQVAQLRSQDETMALTRLSLELDNIRSAMKWAHADNKSELCARLALALHHPLHRSGFWAEASRCLKIGWEALSSSDCVANGEMKKLQATLMLYISGLDYDTGQNTAAEINAKTALSSYLELGDESGQADALNLLGLLAINTSELDKAQILFEEALSQRVGSDHHGRAVALHNLARLASRRGDTAEAQRLYEEALKHREALGDRRGEAETQGDLGVLAHQRGDYETARRYYHESLAIRRKLDDRLGIALMLFNLAEIAETESDWPRAIVLFVHAERIFRELQSPFFSAPNAALKRLERQLGPQHFANLRHARDGATWERLFS